MMITTVPPERRLSLWWSQLYSQRGDWVSPRCISQRGNISAGPCGKELSFQWRQKKQEHSRYLKRWSLKQSEEMRSRKGSSLNRWAGASVQRSELPKYVWTLLVKGSNGESPKALVISFYVRFIELFEIQNCKIVKVYIIVIQYLYALWKYSLCLVNWHIHQFTYLLCACVWEHLSLTLLENFNCTIQCYQLKSSCFTLDPQTLFILQLKVCPTSPYFPPHANP